MPAKNTKNSKSQVVKRRPGRPRKKVLDQVVKKSVQDNKKTFFLLTANSDTLKYNIVSRGEESDNMVEEATEVSLFTIFMEQVKASDDWFMFSTPSLDSDRSDSFEYLIYFRLKNRSRTSSIQNKSKSIGVCRISGCTSDEWQQQLIATRNNKSKYFCQRQPDMNDYNADDLAVFEDPDYLHPWQNSVLEILFEPDMDTVKSGDGRTIYSIVDMHGRKGKSSFIKWLCYRHPLKLGRLSYGTAAQLRSSIINLGTRQAYIVDLPRTRGRRDSLPDLLSAIEDLAGGFVTSPFRGASGQLMMEPPIIFVMSNFKLSYGLMSNDRWRIYEISEQQPYQLSEVTETLLPGVSPSD